MIEYQRRLEELTLAFSKLLASFQSLSTTSDTDLRGAGELNVIDCGHSSYVTLAEADKLRKSPGYSLILDMPTCTLRITRLGKTKKSKPKWHKISWGQCKTLQVGMSQPGYAFGNYSFPGEIQTRTLSRYIAGITKLIQGGGTQGPYLRGVRGFCDNSETNNGYEFNPQYKYLVIQNMGQKRR